MKKTMSLLLFLALALALTGCGSSVSGKIGDQPAGVSDVLRQGMAEADGKRSDTAGTTEKSGAETAPQSTDDAAEKGPDPAPAPEASPAGIDVDLTVLSSTMVYSEVYDMMTSPEDYIGKTVKMKGPFAYYHDEATGNYYFACIIQDAAACCAQGIEFVLTDDYVYPDDYPQVDEEICVVGVFDTYMEGNYTYCTLRDAKIV